MFEQLEMVALRPYVRAQARTSMSDEAFVELQGELGRQDDPSVKRAGPSRARSP